MASAPDILVTASDSPRILLVVEAKYAAKELTDIEPPLKRYMVKMGVPAGLLVTPQIMGIYRNKYTGKSEDSVERVMLFDIPRSWPLFSPFLLLHVLPDKSPGQTDSIASAFEENVQSWLEHLRTSGHLQELSPEAQDAISDYILPALNEGIIRAAHPREYSSEQ